MPFILSFIYLKISKFTKLMKTSHITIALLLITFFSCTTPTEKQTVVTKETPSSITYPDIKVIQSDFPLNIKDVDFSDSSAFCEISDQKIAEIKKCIEKFYFEDCSGDSLETYFKLKDVYIGTIELIDSKFTIYTIILRRPEGILTSKILFFNTENNRFEKVHYEFNIHAMYDYTSKGLEASNLKTMFLENIPEIKIVESDKMNKFQFTRLYHNGTANAVETTLIEVNEDRIDTLEVVKDNQ